MKLGEEREEEGGRWKTAVFLTSISYEDCPLSYLVTLSAIRRAHADTVLTQTMRSHEPH
jgi:hypothetical protein